MNILFGFVEKKFLPGILMTVITALTVGTSVMGVGKMVGGFVSNKTQGSEKSASVKGAEANNTSTKTEKAQVAGAAIKNVPAKTGLTTTNTGQRNNSLTGSTGPTNSNQCIITLFGKQYDITALRSTHSGGDVFACNTDMSAQYQARHGTDMSRMQPYLVTGSTGTSNSPSNTGSGSTGFGQSSGIATSIGSSSKCIIVLFGKQYDVTALRSTHSGGDVFACNTDMSAQYQARHGTDMSRMQPYLVATGGSGTVVSGAIGSSGVKPTPSQIKTYVEDRDKEREDDDD